MTTAIKATDKKPKELTGRRVLLYMMIFFGFMFAVNGTFLYFAITTHPGEDVKKSYLQGLQYNETLAARARQSELGWKAAIGFSPDQTEVLVQLQDASDMNLRGLDIVGELRHLSSRNGDQTLVFERGSDGLYTAPITVPAQGTWSIRIDAVSETDPDTRFEARKELRVP